MQTEHPYKVRRRLGASAFLLTVVMAMPLAAYADTAAIWGRQTGLGKFETTKIDLPRQATITGDIYEGAGSGYCIWAGVPYPEKVVCWRVDDPSLVGSTLPAGKGYFAIPAKRTNNSPAYVEIEVSF